MIQGKNNMQMIDVLKRLAELDAKNPNIVKESTQPMDIEECGDDMMSAEPSQSNSPVSVNISANSGEELGDMLSAIMQLAGVHKVGDEHMGAEPPVSVMTAEPSMHKDAHGVDDMRAVLDQMNNASGEEETDESAASDETHAHGIPGVDTTPADPHKQLPFDPNEFSQNTNDGDGDRANGHPRLTTQPTATYESLMAEYKKFVTEDLTQQNVAEVSGRSINGKEIDLRSLEIDGVDPRDYPDFSDAYISYALFTDGSELNDQEMDQLNDEHGDLVHELAYSSLHENSGQGVAEGLNEFAQNKDGREEGPGDDPYKYPKPEHYSRSGDFFEKFEADHFDHEDFDDATGTFKGYWGNTQIAYFKFNNPQRTDSEDPGMGWYYEPQIEGVAESRKSNAKK
jgi:hypothetical protein